LWWDSGEDWEELPKKKYFAAVSSDLQKRIDDWKKFNVDSKEAKAKKSEAKKSALGKWNQTKEEEYDGHQVSLDAEHERFVREDEFRQDMEWAREQGKVGKELEQMALELREKYWDRRCEAQRQIKLDRLRRYRKFLEREHCPLFLEEYGSYQVMERCFDDEDDEGEYDNSSEGESDESDGEGEDESFYCDGNDKDEESNGREQWEDGPCEEDHRGDGDGDGDDGDCDGFEQTTWWKKFVACHPHYADASGEGHVDDDGGGDDGDDGGRLQGDDGGEDDGQRHCDGGELARDGSDGDDDGDEDSGDDGDGGDDDDDEVGGTVVPFYKMITRHLVYCDGSELKKDKKDKTGESNGKTGKKDKTGESNDNDGKTGKKDKTGESNGKTGKKDKTGRSNGKTGKKDKTGKSNGKTGKKDMTGESNGKTGKKDKTGEGNGRTGDKDKTGESNNKTDKTDKTDKTNVQDEQDKTNKTDEQDEQDKTDKKDKTDINDKQDEKDRTGPPDKSRTRPDKEDHDVKNEPKNKAVEHVIQPHPYLFQEQAETQLELLTGGYTDADEDAATQVAYEVFAQDINEPRHDSAYDGGTDKTEEQARAAQAKDERAREEQGRADGGWAGNGRADDGRADDGRASEGRARTVAGFVGTT
jgi:hypothetical protein